MPDNEETESRQTTNVPICSPMWRASYFCSLKNCREYETPEDDEPESPIDYEAIKVLKISNCSLIG